MPIATESLCNYIYMKLIVKRLHVCTMKLFPVSEMKGIQHEYTTQSLAQQLVAQALEAADQGIKGVPTCRQ